MKIKKAVIPAAGLGTRVLPASKAIPKEMLPIVDKPAIQYIVEEAVAAGITDILIITNRGKGAIEDHFDHAFELEAGLKKKEGREETLKQLEDVAKLANIFFIRQKEAPEKPFYTLELDEKNLTVRQNRGLRNCDRTPEVITFEAEFLKHLLLLRSKKII